MTGNVTSDESTESNREESGDGSTTSDGDVTRRTFMRVTGATAAGAAGITATDDAAAQAETYRFGGEVAAWRGRAPPAIEGQTNPTIELQAGQEYEFWFENIDGQPHNLTIYDADDNALASTELITNEGGTASVTFTATSEMAQYICTIHPTTMVGDLEITGTAQGGGEGGEGAGEGGGITDLPFGAVVLITAMAMAFLSPLLFALFLFSRRGGDREETTTG